MGEAETPPQDQEILAQDQLLELGRLKTREIKIGDARVAVDYAHVPLAESSKDQRRVAIYIGGLPHNPRQDMAGDPLETGFVSELLKGTRTDLIVLKPEGLNREAFVDKDGHIHDGTVTSATRLQLEKIFLEQKINIHAEETEVEIYGLSEGATQGVSLTKRLVDEGANVTAFVGIEPAGVSGYENPDNARIYPSHIHRFREYLTRNPVKKPVQETNYGHHVSADLLQSYGDILGGTDANPKDAFHAVTTFVGRLSAGLAGLKTPRAVQKERLKLAFSENPNYEKVIEAGVPTIFYASPSSQAIPFSEMSSKIAGWREKYGESVKMISSDTSHFDIGNISKGVGLALGLKKD